MKMFLWIGLFVNVAFFLEGDKGALINLSAAIMLVWLIILEETK